MIKFSIKTKLSIGVLAILFPSSFLATAQSFYKEANGIFSTRPDATKSLQNIKRFGPVGMGIDLIQPALWCGLFAYILLHCEASGPLRLWEAARDDLSDDWRSHGVPESARHEFALSCLQEILAPFGRTLRTTACRPLATSTRARWRTSTCCASSTRLWRRMRR